MSEARFYPYRAFISYSSKDGARCARLHKALESFVVPRDLRGKMTGRGPVPKDLRPVFRDRADFSAGPLQAQTLAALRDSQFLVLIASPNSAGSDYVRAEIRSFVECHGTERVLALIVAGEPPACFPAEFPWLAENVAGDVAKDGEREAVVKLVAQLIDVPYAVLWPRDVMAARIRMAGYAAAAVAALAAGGFGVEHFRTKSAVDVHEEKIKVVEERLDYLEQLAREKGVPAAPLRKVLARLGELGVRQEDIPKRLASAADELVKLRTENDILRKGPPEIAAIAAEAQGFIDKGDFDAARAVLARGREAARRLRERATLTEAQLLGQAARVDHLQVDYRAAAEKYGEAARLVAAVDRDKQAALLLLQASELYAQGDEFGDNAALLDAIQTFRAALNLTPRERAPLDWASTQMDLGVALWRLGERESGPKQLEEAVVVLRAALQERTRERVPLDWARTQMNLGNALAALGERQTEPKQLEEAVAAYRAALQETTRERAPLQWARTQMNLGNVLFRLGERETEPRRLEEAVAAYRAALQGNTRERVPLDWAMTQMNLGVALATLGERENEPKRLEEAVAAYRAALQELTRERVPLKWARTQMNLGNALAELGKREADPNRLEEAVTAFRAALQENTRERVPREWAMTQTNLGNALKTLGWRETEPKRLEEAVAAYRAALQEFTRERAPLQWATTSGNQGAALIILAMHKKDLLMAETALHQIEQAAQVLRDGGHAPNAEVYEKLLPPARALVEQLKTASPRPKTKPRRR